MLQTIQECWAWYRERGDRLSPADAWPDGFGFDARDEDGVVLGRLFPDSERREAALEGLVAQVVESRRRLLEGRGDARRRGDWRADGRLLLYSAENSIWDGISETESGGVFDLSDCPGFGLWVDFIRMPTRQQENSGWHSFLVAYIPASLVSLVDRGIDVNCVACIAWADAEASVPSVAAYLRSLDSPSSA